MIKKNKGYKFRLKPNKEQEIYFNKDGNINQANHIDLIAPKKKYTIIFHLGAGDYEFK